MDHAGSHLENKRHRAGYSEGSPCSEGERLRQDGSGSADRDAVDFSQGRAEKRLRLWSDAPAEDIEIDAGSEIKVEDHEPGSCKEGQMQKMLEAREKEANALEKPRGSDDDLLPWQVRFVMGRLCARLGRHPKMVLDNLSQALRLAKVREEGPGRPASGSLEQRTRNASLLRAVGVCVVVVA